jgi:hypothetical protein
MLLDDDIPTYTSISNYYHIARFSSSINSHGLVNSSDYFIHFNLPSDGFFSSHNSFYSRFNGYTSNILPNSKIPPGLLYCSSNLLIFERPPCLKNIQWTPSMLDDISEDSSYYTYQIPLPWQVYFVHFTDDGQYHPITKVNVTFSNTSIYSNDQPLYLPPLTNVYTDSQLCQPRYSLYEEMTDGTDTIEGIINKAYDQVWGSGMNVDLTASVLKYLKHFAIEGIFTRSDSRILLKTRPSYYQNTVARYIFDKVSLSSLDPLSYYTSTEIISAFYSSWEKIPLNEVCNMEWPNIDKVQNDTTFYTSISRHLSSPGFYHYLESNMLTDTVTYQDSSSGCCEDCQYYDEDGDPVPGDCIEEGQCSCHESTPYSYIDIKSVYDLDGENIILKYLRSVNHYPQEDISFIDLYNLSSNSISYRQHVVSNPIISHISSAVNS